ncbi:MAG: ribonuclease D [Balneolales bacterium]|nr:ribonuclease D [Balneolales bacterium]
MNYVYVEHQSEWERCITQLSGVNQIAIDLEFDKNRFRYGFNLCLMQIFDGKEVFLIDPLSKEIDIALIYPLLENKAIQKVCFSFGEDLRLLHSMGCFPKNLYDIQFTGALLNFPPSSLAALIEQLIGVVLSKSSQDSNWFARPLTKKQLKYAVEDVKYLFTLKEVLESRIEQIEITDWIIQENHAFESRNHEALDHNMILKERYKTDMTVFEWFVFSELMMLRDELAQEINRPPFHITERITLENIAKKPTYIDEWASIKSNHEFTKSPLVLTRIQNRLKEAIHNAEEQHLSKTKKAALRLNKEQYLEMKAFEQKVKFAKQKYFRPIQEELIKNYGENAKTFLLSNRLIKDLVAGQTSKLLPYKKKLLNDFSNELGIDIHSFINS